VAPVLITLQTVYEKLGHAEVVQVCAEFQSGVQVLFTVAHVIGTTGTTMVGMMCCTARAAGGADAR
jgi:hypothetical protein